MYVIKNQTFKLTFLSEMTKNLSYAYVFNLKKGYIVKTMGWIGFGTKNIDTESNMNKTYFQVVFIIEIFLE